jgi:hypothetical protein
MPDAQPITADLERELARLRPIEAVVGVATLNNAGTVDAILRAVRRGGVLDGTVRGVVVYADSGSQDGTVERAQDALRSEDGGLPAVSIGDAAARGPAKAAAIRAILRLARTEGAKACAVLDADLMGAGPDWANHLLTPVLRDDVDFVAPYYLRQRFAGAINTGIVYPVTRALYGKRLRYPLAADFACSARLLDRYLSREAVWENELTRFGPELWLTTQVLASGYRACQAFLGAKRPSPEAPVEDLPQTLTRVLGGLFAEVERDLGVWQKVRGSERVELRGNVPPTDPGRAAIDPQRALESFRLGQQTLRDIWAPVLSPLTLVELKKLAGRPDAEFRFPDALWARIVYDFALAYRVRSLNREHLLGAFTPLYLGWLGSFVSEMGDADATRHEDRIEQLCLRYEAEKPYLISRWRWPDRFNP